MPYLLALAIAFGIATAAHPADAADHRDGPTVTADPAADINDLFAWMSADGDTVHLAMTIFPFASPEAAFSDQVQYVFHTASAPSFGAPETTTDIICTFSPDQTIECWVGDDTYISGDASSTTGLSSSDGRVRVFAGARNDPFFFNLSGFVATTETVTSAASGLTFDPAGCPQLDAGTSNLLVNQLQTEPDGSAAQDDFAGATTLALVIAVDKELLTAGGPILGIWGSTNAR